MSYPHSRRILQAVSIAVTASLLGRLLNAWRTKHRMTEFWAGSCPHCGHTMPYFGCEATLHRVWWIDASLPVITWTCDNCEETNKSRLSDEAWLWFLRRGAVRGEDTDRPEMANPITFDEVHDFITNGGLDKIESAFSTQTSGDGASDGQGLRTSKTNRPNRKGS